MDASSASRLVNVLVIGLISLTTAHLTRSIPPICWVQLDDYGREHHRLTFIAKVRNGQENLYQYVHRITDNDYLTLRMPAAD